MIVPVGVFPRSTTGISNVPDPLQIPVVGFGTTLFPEMVIVSQLEQNPVTSAPEFKLTPPVRFVPVIVDGGTVSITGTAPVVKLQLFAASQVVVVIGHTVEPVKLGTYTVKFPLAFTIPVPNTLPDPSVIVTTAPDSPVPNNGVVRGLIGLGM